MVECDFCEEEFEDEQELHLHWGEEHEEELNSHQEEKVKKAERKTKETRQDQMEKRKKWATYGLVGGVGAVFLAVVAMQLLPVLTSSSASFDLDGQPTLGAENASVTVVEFGDYSCPHCKTFEQEVFPKLEENYISTGKIKYSYMNYAFLGPKSTTAAVATECAYDQSEEQFWDYHKAVFNNQNQLKQSVNTAETLTDIARDSTEGLDYNQLKQCISNRNALGEVRSDKQKASSSGVTGTPAVFVNGEKVGNDYASVSSAIDEELE